MPDLETFEDARTLLSHYVPPARSQREAYTLGLMSKLMDYLDNPQDTYKVIHIAGTSGKTSTAYYMAALLGQTGKKVGLTVSPHIDEVNERVQLNLQPLNETAYCRRLNEFLRLIDDSGLKPTYFELLVAFAYWVFAVEKVDYAVVEVGLGGLLDGTNVIHNSSKIAIITDIGYDHTHVLGKSLPEITSQKAGIIKPHNVAIMYEQDLEIMQVVREVCQQQQAELHEIEPRPAKELPDNLPLFQRRNWYLAFSAYTFVANRDSLADLTPEQLASTTSTYIPARMEIVEKNDKTLVLDGAHNAQKIETLIKSMKRRFPTQETAVLFSLVQSKSTRTRAALKEVIKIAEHIIITSFDIEQDLRKLSTSSLKIAQYCDELGFNNFEIIEDPAQAYKALLKRSEPVLLITGSFYLLNHIRPIVFKK